jgi:hypothetical protein
LIITAYPQEVPIVVTKNECTRIALVEIAQKPKIYVYSEFLDCSFENRFAKAFIGLSINLTKRDISVKKSTRVIR